MNVCFDLYAIYWYIYRQMEVKVVAVKNKGGRPKIYDPLELAERINAYCDDNDNPIIKKFCIQPGNPCHDTLCTLSKECTELSESIKRCIAKQEVWYEEQTAKGLVPAAFAIFKLKQPQHGWTDKQQFEHTGENGGALVVKWQD